MRKVNELTIDDLEEISGVDRPAQPGARAVIYKRAVAKQLHLLSEVDGHTHTIDDAGGGGSSSYEKMTGEEYGHSHPWIVTLSGQIVIGASAGHTHEVMVLKSAPSTAPSSGDTLPAPQNTPGVAGGQPKPTHMTDTKDPAAQLAEVTKKVADLSAELLIAKAIGEFSDAEKALYKGMDAAGQEAFRKLDPAARLEKLRSNSETNPVIYTSPEGETFRKNDDPRMIALAKRADETAKHLAAERAIRASENFRKRAGEELKNLPGEEVAKVELLRAVEGISDAAVRASVQALLKAGNDAMAKGFRELGTSSGAPDSSAEAAHEKLVTIAKGLREKDSKLDDVGAYAKACELNQELYEQAVGTTVGEES